jgi:hypothetical protein
MAPRVRPMTYLPRWGNNFSQINFNQFHSTDATRPMDISPRARTQKTLYAAGQTGIYKVSSTSRSNHIGARACGQMNGSAFNQALRSLYCCRCWEMRPAMIIPALLSKSERRGRSFFHFHGKSIKLEGKGDAFSSLQSFM